MPESVAVPPLAAAKTRTAAAGAIIALAALAAYANSLAGPFIFDDPASIADNPTIHRLWPLTTVLSPPAGNGLTVEARPILNLSLAINYAISGTNVWSYHVVNLLIHILAGLTLFGIVRRTLGWSALSPTRWAALPVEKRVGDNALHQIFVAFVVALLWTVHPLQTESVTYIIQRAESLMGLFYLVTLYCFIRGTELEKTRFAGPEADRSTESAPGGELLASLPASGPRDPRAAGSAGSPGIGQHRPSRTGLGSSIRPRPGGRWWYILSVLACLLGMATKEVMVSAPVIVFLYDRTFVAGGFREAWRRRRGYYLALGATWLLAAWLIFGAGGNRGGTIGFGSGVSWGTYALSQFGAIARYLRLSFWPHPLIIDYGAVWTRGVWAVGPGAVLVIGLVGATGYALLRAPTKSGGVGGPALGFVGAWFLVILAPTSSVIPGNRQTIAEHRMYLPLAAVVVLAVLVWEKASSRRMFAVGGVIAAAALAAATVARNAAYRTELGLYADMVAHAPDDAYARADYGHDLLVRGRLDEAIGQLREATELRPDYAYAFYNLGDALDLEGRYEESVACYREAVRLQPDHPVAFNNLANALVGAGRPQEALGDYETALRLDPNFAEAHYALANTLSALGRRVEAIPHYEAALRDKPDFPEAHNNFGIALGALGRIPEAIAQFEAALRLQPDHASARFNLGNAYAMSGRLDEAIAQYEEALRLQPDFPAARRNLDLARRQAAAKSHL